MIGPDGETFEARAGSPTLPWTVMPPDQPPVPLTSTELDLLRVFAAGGSASEAARSLGTGLFEVGIMAHDVRRKLQVTSTAAAVAAARDAGHHLPAG